jgi:hypothetical protein
METKSQSAYVFTQDLKLAAVLLKMGFEPYAAEPITRISQDGKQPVCYFNFVPDGEINTFIKAWHSPSDSLPSQPGHPLNNPEHLFWHCRHVLQNREHLLDAVKNTGVNMFFERHGRRFLIKTKQKS